MSDAQRSFALDRRESWPKARAPKASESQVQSAVLKFLQWHPKVAWAHRMNTGAAYMVNVDEQKQATRKPRFVRFAFTGCADIIGQMKDGRFLAIECKGHLGAPTEAQAVFLRRVREASGVAGIAWGLADAERIINDATGVNPF